MDKFLERHKLLKLIEGKIGNRPIINKEIQLIIEKKSTKKIICLHVDIQ